MSEELVIHFDDKDTGAVATWGPVVYVVWRSHASLDCIQHADLAVERLVKRFGAGRKLFYVQRAPHSGGIMKANPEVREGAMKHFERHDAHFAAAAVAIEAQGFSGSVIRSVTAGVLLVRKTAVKTESFKDARDGVRWLATIAKDVNPFDAEAMIKALEAADLALK
jgi:cytochrome c556